MAQPVSRNAVQAFFQAYMSRDAGAIAAQVHDDVQWTIIGPVTLLPFCGQHRGREAIFDLFRHKIPAVFEFKGFAPEDLLIDGERVAVFGRLSGVQRRSGRMISYRSAQFMRFADDKLICARFLLDSFDAAEQILGRPLDLFAQDCEPQTARGDLVAV